MMSESLKPLQGWRVLVPRGGPWGHGIAADLRAIGALPVVAPLINFAPTEDTEALVFALDRLASGSFDWLTVMSATTVDVLLAHQASVPLTTRIAAVGETTAAALVLAGYKVDLVPHEDNSAEGLLAEMKQFEEAGASLRILTLRSEIAKSILTPGLVKRGHTVESVIAYRTIGVPIDPSVKADVAAGLMQALLITSGSVAEQIQLQLGAVPESTIVACIGPVTAQDARSYGLRVDLVAQEGSASSLIEALIETAKHTPDR